MSPTRHHKTGAEVAALRTDVDEAGGAKAQVALNHVRAEVGI